ncbi:CRISPR-associated endonuclease Cas2 [bacterium]|nr:CRISPR-associated endonuclease Cas2 [bacterium]
MLVTYDVSTSNAAGRRRLRRIARVCKDYGQRVQKSVFECQVDNKTYAKLEERLLKEISLKDDNLRIYSLASPIEGNVKEFGQFRRQDFSGPLVL